MVGWGVGPREGNTWLNTPRACPQVENKHRVGGHPPVLTGPEAAPLGCSVGGPALGLVAFFWLEEPTRDEPQTPSRLMIRHMISIFYICI